MARDLNLLFDYECKRRPYLAMLRDTVATLSVAEIDAAKLPMKWMRQVLLARQRQYHAGIEQARLLASLNDRIVDGVQSDPLGEMRRWTGQTTFLRMARGASIQVHPDNLLWLPLTGGVWLETVFSAAIDPALDRASVSLGIVRRTAYTAAHRAITNRLAQFDPPLLMTQGQGPAQSQSHVLATYGVRFR